MRSWGAEHDADERLRLLRPLICFPFMAGLLLSWPLWQQERLYPLAPVADWLRLPAGGDPYVSAALLALLLLTALSRWRWPLFAALACYALLAMLDQSRLQPWAYMYALLLLLAGFAHSPQPAGGAWVLSAVRYVLCADYLWSGLKKLNPGFAHDVFPWFIEPVTRYLPQVAADAAQEYWYLAAIAEAALALLLLFPRTRDLGIFAAVGMHLLILYCLGPLGHNWNTVVWPWNIALCALVLFAFGTTDSAWHVATRTKDPRVPAAALAPLLVVCGLLPALSFWNHWDEYLSFSLYSGNVSMAQLNVSAASLTRMPRELSGRAVLSGVDEFVIDIYSWSFEELQVPAYPESRVFIAVAREMQQRYGIERGDIVLVIHRKSSLFGQRETIRLSGRLLEP